MFERIKKFFTKDKRTPREKKLAKQDKRIKRWDKKAKDWEKKDEYKYQQLREKLYAEQGPRTKYEEEKHKDFFMFGRERHRLTKYAQKQYNKSMKEIAKAQKGIDPKDTRAMRKAELEARAKYSGKREEKYKYLENRSFGMHGDYFDEEEDFNSQWVREGSKTQTDEQREQAQHTRENFEDHVAISNEDLKELERMRNEDNGMPMNVTKQSAEEGLQEGLVKLLDKGNEELLDVPEIIHLIRSEFVRKGKEAMNSVDFTEDISNALTPFRTNTPWIKNFSALVKHVISAGGSTVENVMEGIDLGTNLTKGQYAESAMDVSMNIADDIRDNVKLQDLMMDLASIIPNKPGVTPDLREKFVTNFVVLRAYSSAIFLDGKNKGNKEQADVAQMINQNAAFGSNHTYQFKGATLEHLNPAMQMFGGDDSIQSAVGEAIGTRYADMMPRRGFRRTREHLPS